MDRLRKQQEHGSNINNQGNSSNQSGIFKGIKITKGLKNAAYNYILNGNMGNTVAGLINGECLASICISAKEYVYGRASQMQSKDEYKQKMRMSTSIIDLIDNAYTSYDASHQKNGKLFLYGFKNYQGRVGIDDVIFRYYQSWKSKNGTIYYDINLEVDSKAPRANRTSLIKKPTSNNVRNVQ